MSELPQNTSTSVTNTVWAIDPTGKFILEEKIRTKLLQAPEPLRIALVTAGKYDANYKKALDAGWTLVRHRMGNASPETFDSLEELLQTLVAESDLPMSLVAAGTTAILDG